MTRELGNSGIMVHPIGMGCWAYGGGAYWGEQSQADVNEIVSAALDAGLNFFDTAEMYNGGASEIALGEALRGKRNKAVVATKIGPNNCNDLEAHLDASLKRLQTDYVDLYMLHWPINTKALEHFTKDAAVIKSPPTVESTFEALMNMRKKGKIRAIGVSNFGKTQLEEVLATGAVIDVNEMAYNIVSRAIEAEIAPCCRVNCVSVVGSMALAQGLLAGIYNSAEEIPEAQAHSRHFKQERGGSQSRHYEDGAEDEIFALMPKLKDLATRMNVSLARLSIAWVLQKPFIAATLVGSRNRRELDDNVETARLTLPDDVMKEIDALSLPVLKKLGDNADYYENGKNGRIF